MSLSLESRQVGNVTIIDAIGLIVLRDGAATAFRNKLKELIDKGKLQILVNLTQTTKIDSSGIGELVSGFTTVTNHGGTLKLLGTLEHINQLLQPTHLITVFEIHENEKIAVQSFD